MKFEVDEGPILRDVGGSTLDSRPRKWELSLYMYESRSSRNTNSPHGQFSVRVSATPPMKIPSENEIQIDVDVQDWPDGLIVWSLTIK